MTERTARTFPSARTLTLEQALPHARGDEDDRDALARRGACDAGPSSERDPYRRVQLAEDEHQNRRMIALGFHLVGAGLLFGLGGLGPTMIAIALGCFTAGAIIHQQARQRLRAALIERAVGEGASRERAAREADSTIV